MNITSKIKKIQYRANCCQKKLKTIKFRDFDVNTMPTRCMVSKDDFTYAVSKWVSPKRTRSYPYERVYDTLATSNKCVTIIPVVKDEGLAGDRDYLQWDTVSLMSLFDVFVILAYYIDADANERRENKITNQRFDNAYVKEKLEEISGFRSSALHWNLQEMEKTLPDLLSEVREHYSELGKKLNVEFHREEGIDKFQAKIYEGVEKFKRFSRSKAQKAQNREQQTRQPKEALSTLTKATITINNYLGGEYYFTTDEIKIDTAKGILFLIEGKHSKFAKLPSLGDIKDGLLKLILYTNLENVSVDGKSFQSVPVLKLTSEEIHGEISLRSSKNDIDYFFKSNSFSRKEKKIITDLFREARKNKFTVLIKRATT